MPRFHIITTVIALWSLTYIVLADSSATLAPGYGPLAFQAPAAGTYQLPMLGQAADGTVLDSQGKTTQLHQLMGDKIVLLSFIYSTCSDINGCPLATAVFHKIKHRLAKDPKLAKSLRLLTLSFNPEHDTPAQMQKYSESLTDDSLEWLFLTTQSEAQLNPILEDYQQQVQKIYDAQGQFTGTFSHILRVYLIDKDKQIRNIYSVSFLHPDTLINDFETLLDTHTTQADKPIASSFALFQAGDNKVNYQNKDYTTRSIALEHRTGQEADLIKNIQNPPLGLPPIAMPTDASQTQARIQLGRKLFYDRRLSLNNTFSCAMCHIPEQGFTSNEMKTAVGIEGRTVRRNSPTLYNVGYATSLFHDGRETTLEQQVWGPLLARNEMGNPSIGYVIEKIKTLDNYPKLFAQAFGKPPGMETIGMAIADYERALNSANSPFDRWHYGQERQTISESAARGFALFTGKANCSACHTLADYHALFTDQQFHNTGIGYAEAMMHEESNQNIQIAPGVFVDVASQLLDSVSAPEPNDLGRYEVTQQPEDRWRYKTPSLRNIALTAPYMHNGSLATLKEVIQFYNRGGISNENLDSLIKPLKLSDQEMADLDAFLLTLTGANVNELVADAFAAPIGDSR